MSWTSSRKWETMVKCCRMLRSSLELLSHWPCGAPRGKAVTRFPGTRQEEEKQNKPERAVTACGLHWKGNVIISNTGHTRGPTPRETCVGGVLKVSTTVFHPFRGKLGLAADGCFHRRGGLALKLTVGRLLLCIGLQLGWGRGRTEAILTEAAAEKEARLSSSALKTQPEGIKHELFGCCFFLLFCFLDRSLLSSCRKWRNVAS